MPVEQNTLRAAIDRILGFTPGGSAAGAGGGGATGLGGGGGATGLGAGGGTAATALGAATTPTGGEVESGQRPVYSSNMSAMRQPFSNISGAARQSGPVFDPFAGVNAELSALKQKNADLAASLGIKPATAPAPTTVTTGPALSPQMQAQVDAQMAQTRALGESSLNQSMASRGYERGPTGAWQPIGMKQPLPMGTMEARRQQMMGGSPFLISRPGGARTTTYATYR
jgi:hypothetical protein